MSNNKKQNKRKVMFWIVFIFVGVIVIGTWAGWRWLAPSSNDYRKMGWTEAFDQLHSQVSVHYPFTEWKALEWDALYAQTAPRIAEAEANNDPEAYYLALREYTFAIPDGHVQLAGEDFGLREIAIGGGYGLGIVGLDDGRTIAHILLEDGPAAKASMDWGAEIIAWNSLPIAEAVAQTDIMWAEGNQPTSEGRLLEQYRYLTRAPIGTKATITFQNPDIDIAQTVTLVAEDDQLETLTRTQSPELTIKEALFTPPIQSEILPSGYGYLFIRGFMPSPRGLSLPKLIDDAIKLFVAEDVPGIIIDVRGNGGGLDAVVPHLVGYFYTEPIMYEQIAYYDVDSSQFQVNPDETLHIEPQNPHYDGSLMVLVDKETVSTAEGPPLTIQQLPQGQVTGLSGTHGSFAMDKPGKNLYHLPEGVAFNFFAGRSLDENLAIQVDANAEGIGGVVPDIRVPMTEETAYALFVEGRDVVLETAVSTLNEMNK